MIEIVVLLSAYYKCSALLAEDYQTRSERIACNLMYQQIKRSFVQDAIGTSDARLTPEQNALAYQRFRSWEAANADLVRDLKAR